MPAPLGTNGTRAGLSKCVSLTMPMIQARLLAKHGKKRNIRLLTNVSRRKRTTAVLALLP